jgi:hypothetical protein
LAATATGVALVIFGCTTGGAASPPNSGPVATGSRQASTPAPTVAISPYADPSRPASGARLVVLASAGAGAKELWVLTAAGSWQDAGAVSGATALSRSGTGVAIAFGHGVQVRAAGDLSHAAGQTALTWPGLAPTAPIVGLDATDASLAFVTGDDTTMAYATATTDGTVTPVTPAPSQSFSPMVARLDSSHLVVMTMDGNQVSRLAVIDTANHTITTSKALGGIRDFALSADRQIVAVATAGGAYTSSVSDFMAGKAPKQVATVQGASVVWGLALDATGSQLYLLSGTVASDGTVGSVHELGYTRQGSGWTRSMDSATPFASAVDQVCLR